jgi:hypothetical protein
MRKRPRKATKLTNQIRVKITNLKPTSQQMPVS